VRAELPLYAAPLFIRLTTATMDVTATFKHKKTELVEQGFNPHIITVPSVLRVRVKCAVCVCVC
jgi:fatty-acyl-CoA synthase